MWKKEDRERHSRRVLTAGENRVTADRRFNVLHDAVSPGDQDDEAMSGGDVWVLVIKDAKPSDSGIYVCEVNSSPILRSFHKLSVLSRVLLPPDNMTDPMLYDSQKGPQGRSHNYTDCCVNSNVSSSCFGFCNIQSILEGNTGQDPENCEKDFPAIVRCMADGRNHVPCCIQEAVPDICQDVCRGEYTVITDNIKTHFSCSAYTEQTLSCIVEGIEILPSPPENVEVEGLTEKALKVSWTHPLQNPETVSKYVVNVTMLRSFDEDTELPDDSYAAATDSYVLAAGLYNATAKPTTSTLSPQEDRSTLIKIPGKYNTTIVNTLKPYTMYELSVTALNIHGSSLPSYSVRTLTLTPGQTKPNSVAQVPELPDIKTCCTKKGISHPTCVEKLCDPALSDIAEVTDLMICAPWAAATFSCLTNGVDHTSCCQARGLPDLCQELCTGNITQLDFSYFKCLKYMSDYTNCLLQGYGVLPSAPTKVHVSHIDIEFSIINWDIPSTLGDTVLYYNVHYRKMATYDNEYHIISKVHSPFILENLSSNTDYEVFVEAVNGHGVGEPSTRVIFRTESKLVEEKTEEASFYNVTACCVEADLNDVCFPLCSYNANMSDIKSLAGICGSELHKLLRCGAGGRNHGSCCSRRGVPNTCLSICSGVIVDSLIATATACIPFIGNIVQCFEEGTGLLPGPVSELHATSVTNTSVALQWEPPTDGSNVTDYVIHYQKLDNTSIHETVQKLSHQLSLSDTRFEISGLETGAMYNFFVVSKNMHGTSLPSSILMINVTNTVLDDKGIPGVTSPPHSLAVSSHSATWVTISWQPPEFSQPAEHLSYKLYHKSTADDEYHAVMTSVTSHTIEGLNPNTQYIVYVTAISEKGQSLPSETLIAWTDPAYPAFVEPPTVHPINLVMEGSSMTILCIAMGTPMPTISLYISGRLVRQETTRHMVTVIHNVTKDMDQISCYADNGYGTPMQASRKIAISHQPHITASGITMASHGDSVVLECTVGAYPDPKMIFWRDQSGRVPVIQGGKYDINIQPAKDEEAKYIMRLTINKISDSDDGDYFCHAENAFGSGTQPVSVRIRNMAATNNVTQCCIEQNVTAECMDACSFYLDIDAVIDKPECINDFDKLMKCAADGSDHRSCCAQWGVPRRCLDWCRGEPLFNNKFCVLSYTKQIMSCFHEGRDRLPGPPQNVHIELVDAKSVRVRWDPPVKNPNTVEIYRVFWRQLGSRSATKNDTKATSLRITGLKDGSTYECVIKAGNHLGTSTLTEPVRFTIGDKYITSAASLGNDSSSVGVAVGIVLALIIVAAIVIGAVWFMRTRRMLGRKSSGGVAFENPSYLREVNMDHIQIPASQNDSAVSNGTANGVNPAGSHMQAQQGWKQETLHVPAQATEVAPSLYEELKLGQDGAGFKRLK
ncbi:Ig-like and fibronectin type-III domain-containing protein 1 [Zootermopsis nevadensis]|uniref:Ig-like and fibronectin type-III domain-containing protein C25G4.10 n=1 Tax=Zootermopsis nevadensis TaxID=136037 RepID=A0A067R523_ZOONE|nr:Ig-like and fibronectin type-III domain-containing protein 1 [Zootermopsis nevadensis]KDR18237.1 Ig-like and fibronectin type-III domain-containing protein C25G4.10 [Zootermopsis nevadensis]